MLKNFSTFYTNNLYFIIYKLYNSTMSKREFTKPIKVGNVQIGGNNKIIIQSMCDIKTSNIDEIVNQINECAALGADMMRLSILDKEDAYALKEIKKHINIPIVADIHFDYKLGLLAIENGADKIRINPGNIGGIKGLEAIIESCKLHNTPIRIGVNKGSLEKDLANNCSLSEEEKLVESALRYVKIFESYNFYNLVISVKASNPIVTLNAYRLISTKTNYPLHIGVTESGYDEIGIIRSVSALAPLILEGIGSTIRISLTHNPQKEIKTCVRLLHDLGLYPQYPTIISCPTCGRCQVSNTATIADAVLEYLIKHKKYITVAIMGCVVNGIGEGKNADIGLAGGKDCFIVFKKGTIIKTVPQSQALNALFEEIEKL